MVFFKEYQLLEDRALRLSASKVEAEMKTLRRLVLKLAVRTNMLPSSFMLQGVQCILSFDHYGGSFADVYRGTMGTTTVAVKRLRTYSTVQASTEKQRIRLEQVYFPLTVSYSWRSDHDMPFPRTFAVSLSSGKTYRVHTFSNFLGYQEM